MYCPGFLFVRLLLCWAQGTGPVSGFTPLCKGLAVVLVGGYILTQVFPPAMTYLALIPARYFCVLCLRNELLVHRCSSSRVFDIRVAISNLLDNGDSGLIGI